MNANIMNNTSKTDWARINTMKDEDIDTSDIPPLSEDFLANNEISKGTAKNPIICP